MSRFILICGLTLAAASAVVWQATPTTSGEIRLPDQPRPVGEPLGARTAVGLGGCLAAACHGGPATTALAGALTGPMWPASGTCWVARDPHAGAYDALVRRRTRLGGPDARGIVANLGGTGPAAEDARCLACHTNPALASPGPTTDVRVRSLRAEGVSCEACHGNAGGWLHEHTAGRSADMTPLTDVGDRAAACLGCHLGAPADPARGYPLRDVNHDMIAAGHPRLSFDYATYLGRLPKHWREQRPTAQPREWFVGRIAHAEAACRLLADRAERAKVGDERTPWPEFAEFDCAACHHPLAPLPDPVEKPGLRGLGVPPWQTIWPLTHGPSFAPLRNLLAVTQTRVPAGPHTVAPVARVAGQDLATFRASLATLSDAQLTRKVAPLIGWTTPSREDWHQAAQILNGLSRLDRSGLPLLPLDRATEAFRHRNWPATRDALDAVLNTGSRPNAP